MKEMTNRVLSEDAKALRAEKNSRCRTRNIERQATRRAAAEARNAEWTKLTPAAKLKALDERFGHGKGAKRQRAKLAK